MPAIRKGNFWSGPFFSVPAPPTIRPGPNLRIATACQLSIRSPGRPYTWHGYELAQESGSEETRHVWTVPWAAATAQSRKKNPKNVHHDAPSLSGRARVGQAGRAGAQARAVVNKVKPEYVASHILANRVAPVPAPVPAQHRMVSLCFRLFCLCRPGGLRQHPSARSVLSTTTTRSRP